MSTYDYYRIFYHVAQQHSFTKAAEVLHNNQPNITRCMNNLETELGCHRSQRKCTTYYAAAKIRSISQSLSTCKA